MTRTRILVVEDEEIIAALIARSLTQRGYEVTVAGDGETGWSLLQEDGHGFMAVLLDRGLPGLDGLALLRKIKEVSHLAHIPVIMQTAAGEGSAIREGLGAGAYYYLVKPFERDLLLAIVTAAVNQYREILEMQGAVRRAERALRYLRDGVFTLRTLEEAREMANALAGAYPDPGRVVFGLQELLVNAVEHGNLGITYREKTALVVNDGWRAEVDRRLALPENRDKRVRVAFRRRPEAITVEIADQGAGFDWPTFLDLDPERAFDPHGRGIAMARLMSFDSLEYLGTGNTVRVSVATPPA